MEAVPGAVRGQRARRVARAMKPPITERELSELPEPLRFAFAPLDKRALGLAFGATFGLAVFGITAYHLLLDDWLLGHVEVLRGRPYSGSSLWLLAHYFRGYNPETWSGGVIGGLWGLWSGFIAGWFVAFARNLFVALWLFGVRTRQQLAASREFLDHI
jgi:hypothetical protein